MAQIDSSIALGVRPPQFENRLAQLAQMEQLSGMREASELRGLQSGVLRQEQADNALMRQILTESNGDLEKAGATALTRGLVKPGLDLQKRVAESKAATLTGRKLEGDIAAQGTAAEKARLEGAMQQFSVIGQIMGGVKDQASYDLARQQAASVLGREAAAKIPPVYDPAAIERNRQQAMTMQQQIEARYKALGFDQQERQFGETQRHNRASEATAAATANRPSPGQFFVLADGTTVLGDPRTGLVNPAQFGTGARPPVQGPGPGALPPMPGALPPMPGAPPSSGMQPGGVSPPAAIAPPAPASQAPGGMPAAPNMTPGAPVMQKPPVMPRELPTDVQNTLRENAGRLSQIDAALAEVTAYPAAFGLTNAIPGAELVTQYTDPQGVRARAAVADIGSKQINDRSGAAVTISEYPRLAPFVPKASDKPEVVKEKLKKLRDGIAEEQRLFASAYGTDQGYRGTPLLNQGGGGARPGGLDPADPLGLLGGAR